MINNYVKDVCCLNCLNCFNICPVGAIRCAKDDLGFSVPIVDETKCVRCKKCIIVCPAINSNVSLLFRNKNCSTAYGFRNNDTNELFKATSGGAFKALADRVISDGGVVFAAKFNDSFEGVSHSCATSVEELNSFVGVKYVQSQLLDIFPRIKSILKDDKVVLFVGTPCQVAALLLFIREPNLIKNLVTVDLICHGVPSPRIFEDFIVSLKKKYHKEIVGISFRNKKIGWRGNNFSLSFADGSIEYFKNKNSYVSFFEQSYSIHNACFSCNFSKKDRVGDITIGDFWGIEKYNDQYNDEKGISIVIANSDKGKQLTEAIMDSGTIFKLEYSSYKQKNLVSPTSEPFLKKQFDAYYIKKGLKKAEKRYSLTTTSGKIFNIIARILKKVFYK